MSALRAACAFCLVAALPAWAQVAAPAKPVYAVLSLIGDKVDVIVTRALPGQDQAAASAKVTVKEGVFDALAVDAASRGIWAVTPKNEIAQLSVRGHAIFEKQGEWFAESGGKIRIPQEVQDGARQQGATHLVLLMKHRAPLTWDSPGTAKPGVSPRFRGSAEGLGFLIDVPAGKEGVIVAFAHFQVLVIDLAAQTVIGRNPVVASSVLPADAPSADIAWRDFSAWQKARVMEFIIRDRASYAVQSLFELIAPAG